MFFKRTERKKHHPILVASLAALTVIGGCTVVGMSKAKMQKICTCVKNFCMKKKDAPAPMADEPTA